MRAGVILRWKDDLLVTVSKMSFSPVVLDKTCFLAQLAHVVMSAACPGF